MGIKVDWEAIDRINRELDGLMVEVGTAAERAKEEHITTEHFAHVDSSGKAGSAAVDAMSQLSSGMDTAYQFLRDYVAAIAAATKTHVSHDDTAAGSSKSLQKGMA